MSLQTITNYARGSAALEEVYRQLEVGNVLLFPASPFEIPEQDKAFLVSQRQSGAAYHKNISYRPVQDRLKGLNQKDPAARQRMLEIMRTYAHRVIKFMGSFLPRYQDSWRVDYASFRPVEEEGRRISLRSRNDLLHVDSFPTRPSQGARLLRVFTNVNPTRPRVWITSDNFEQLARRYAEEAGLLQPPGVLRNCGHSVLRALAGVGLPLAPRSEYDRFMLRFHHFMKGNTLFQQECPKERIEFPPGSTWIVFTDMTSHACLSGQHMLEQTFFVERTSLACPAKAPVAILERLAQRRLTP